VIQKEFAAGCHILAPAVLLWFDKSWRHSLMFKTPALALASFLLLAAPAVAQRSAPITQGTTSLDLADQISQARQLSADTKVQVNGIASDVMTLTRAEHAEE
jgi:hypothetical protein